MIGQTHCGTMLAGMCALLGLLWPGHVAATTYAVGSGAGCSHVTVQDAINAAAIDASAGPHLIKLTTGTIGVPNGLTLHNAVTNITIEGGYASCAGTLGSNTRTVLDAAGGVDGTVLDIRYFAASPQRRITLSRLDITGGTGETGIFSSSEGAGLELRGNLAIDLKGTRVRDNRAFRAAGVLIQGGPGRITFSLDQGSTVSGNVADTDGGGIWCNDLGSLYVDGGSTVEFNQAGRDGGGLWLGTRCFLMFGSPVRSEIGSNVLANNTAGTVYGGRGGGLFLQTNLSDSEPQIEFFGIPPQPVLVLNNQALSGPAWTGEGGALYLEGNAPTRQQVKLINCVLINNSVQGTAGAAISARQAVELTLQGSPARCAGLFGFGACSAIAGSNDNALYVRDTSSTSDTLAPQVHISRTRFTQNSASVLGLIYFRVDFNPAASMDIDSSLFDGNQGDGLVHADRFVSLTYSTVSGNTFTTGSFLPAVFHAYVPINVSSREFDLRGSVIWQPAVTLLRNESGGLWQATHGGCLLSADLTGVVAPAAVRTGDPLLGGDFTPALGSPALDACNATVGSPATDVYGSARPIDLPGIPNGLGPYDLGAVERPLADLIFADGFQ